MEYETPKRELLDTNALIAESDGLYKQWWILWKRNHPETGLITKQEPEVPYPKILLYLRKSACVCVSPTKRYMWYHVRGISIESFVRPWIHLP